MEIECKIDELDHLNDNKRIYPRDVLERAIQNYNEKPYKFGELGFATTQNIELQHISHKINGVKLKNNNFCVNIELLDTPSGKIIKNIIKAGLNLNIKPRMIINTKRVKNGPGKYTDQEVVTEMDIISFDLIWYP